MPVRVLNLVRQMAAERQLRDRLEQQQLDLLRKLVRSSYEQTTAYRCLMQRAGVTPDDIVSLNDIQLLPIVSKQDLLEFTESERTNRNFKRTKRTKRILTSGSTGMPYEFDIDPSYDKWRKAQYLRPYLTNGRRPWYQVLRLTVIAESGVRAGSRWNPFRENLLDCASSTSSQISALRRLRPVHVQGYPSALRCLAFDLLSQNLRTPYVTTVFTDSELLTPDTRALIENAFDAPVLDVYGAYETDNIAYQCAHESDYHVAIDSVIAEVVVDGQSVVDQNGDLVVTVLQNRTTPFIRYNLQDHVRLLPSKCLCGRSFPLMKIVAGRRDDLACCANGSRKSPMSMLARLDSLSGLIREYQIAQTGIDEFVARIVPASTLSASDEARIRDAIRSDHPNADVTVETHSQLVRAQAAKLKAFVNEMSPTPGSGRGN